jgi:uncharacterized repeat protein (TIGR01451 family)
MKTMNKVLTILITLVIATTEIKAQYVTIPDANFRAYLISIYPSCFNASQQMDTTCNLILSTENFDMDSPDYGGPASFLNIPNLEGIQYFKNLSLLSCRGQQITSIPDLENLSKLVSFYVSGNLLTELPALPDTLSGRETPFIMGGWILCDHNLLTSLGPNRFLCKELNCSYNNLSELSELTIASELYIQHNNIYCILPGQGASTVMQMDTSKIHCGGGANYTYDEYGNEYNNNGNIFYPQCTLTFNPHNCFINPAITGKIFYDNNSNGIKDPTELYRRNVKVQLSQYESGHTDVNGRFILYAGSLGNQTVTVISPSYYTVPPPAITVNLTSYDTVSVPDIPLQPTAAIDSVAISITPMTSFRPGNNVGYKISYDNVGTTTISPGLVFNYNNSLLTYTGSSLAGVINNGNSLNFSEANFTPGQYRSFNVYFTLSTGAIIGSTVNTGAILSGGNAIAHDTLHTVVTGPIDPNDKMATPALTTTQVNAGAYIDYIIRFQNTGSDTAFNVVVADTLNAKLLQGSVIVADASAVCEMTEWNNKVFFKFTNIMLPDSNVNEPLSHGFVKFRVKAKSNLPPNDVINNRAGIYFDYNNAVLTNTASTIINTSTVPLTLLTFKGYTQPNNTALLNWTTANEVNTRSFEIEQSGDSRIFNFIATVAANGRGDNSYMQKVNLPADITYYRLKMIDIDGKFAYSPIIKISINKNASGIVLLGNPVKGSLVVNITDKSIYNTTATIINNLGAVVKTVLLKEGLQNIDVSELATGNYFIRTNSGSQKIIITK